MTYSSLIEILFRAILFANGTDPGQKLLQKIALAVKQLREQKGVTQEDVYNEINIHIGRIETAKANLTVSTLSALCKYFRIKLSVFHKMVEEI